MKDPWDILETVYDPEIPVLSVVDLGIIRKISEDGNNIEITITPTYNGCPAMKMMEANIEASLSHAGFRHITIHTILFPPWTTDWISEAGKLKLKEYGIAPPEKLKGRENIDVEDRTIHCPVCNSSDTEMISEFGSTACKSLFRCKQCLEPFDYFKCH